MRGFFVINNPKIMKPTFRESLKLTSIEEKKLGEELSKASLNAIISGDIVVLNDNILISYKDKRLILKYPGSEHDNIFKVWSYLKANWKSSSYNPFTEEFIHYFEIIV